MIECLSCQTSNSIDSQFCKGCGKALSQDAIEAAVEEHEAFVAEGQKALAEGRVDEALLISHSAVEQNPDSIHALSLRGMVYERQGRIAEALEAFERVVVLNPTSSLDKIKVQQLRNSLSSQVLYAPQQDRKRAFVGAAAATLLVVGAGAIIAVYAQRPNAQTNLDSGKVATNLGRQQNLLNSSPTGAKPNLNSEGAGETSGTVGTDKTKNPGDVGAIRNGVEGGVTNRGSTLPSGVGTRLPSAGGVDMGQIPPYEIGPPTIVANSGNRPPNPNNDDIDPKVGDGKTGNSNPPVEPTKPQDDPGVIEINVKPKAPTNRGGGSDVDQGLSSKALSEAARQQFQLQKYDQAAKSYERLLAMGGDPATINQRLGQCYSNMGQTGNAASAYKRAISAISDRLKNSSGDTAYLDRQLESCQRALKVLGG